METPAKEHGIPVPKLVIAPCPFRQFVAPLMQEIHRVKRDYPNRQIAVVIPEVMETRWWHVLLHRRKPAKLRSALLRCGDHQVVVINVPWYLE